MSLFNHTYSGLVTGGLGLPACCGSITMGFHLFKCKIEVVIPPMSGGGGGGGPYAGFYVPMTKQFTHSTRMVLITVKLGERTWRESFVVGRYRTNLVVKAINIVNKVKHGISITVSNVKRLKRKISAIFTKQNK